MPSWSAIQVFEPALPQHCEPANNFLHHISATFHTCVPSNLALISTLLGTFSIVSWLFAQLPQIYKNYTLKSTSGLSIWFLGEWLLGDLSNFLGCILTKQALWQMVIAAYYCSVDCMLVGQWLWYEVLQHKRPAFEVWGRGGRRRSYRDGNMAEVIEGMPAGSEASKREGAPNDSKLVPHSSPQDMFRTPKYASSPSKEESLAGSSMLGNRTIHRLGRSNSPMPSPSPRTVLYVSLLLAVVARASPLQPVEASTASSDPAEGSAGEAAGRVLSWLSTLLYLGSRLPQLYKNHVRRSTAGLSPTLFIAAFFGNLFYSSSILTNPCAWDSFPAYGGGGWVGAEGSDRETWVALAIPFWLGAAGVLIMDAAVGLQFWWFGGPRDEERQIVALPEDNSGRWRWRRVSGWMRGWVPSISEASTPRPGSVAGQRGVENDRLLGGDRDVGRGYGAV